MVIWFRLALRLGFRLWRRQQLRLEWIWIGRWLQRVLVSGLCLLRGQRLRLMVIWFRLALRLGFRLWRGQLRGLRLRLEWIWIGRWLQRVVLIWRLWFIVSGQWR